MSKSIAIARRATVIEPTLIRTLRANMGSDTIDFGLGQGDLPVAPAVREQWQQEGELYAAYTPNAGLDKAREAVAEHEGCNRDEVMLTCGVQQGLAVALYGLCEEGDEVLVPDPGFPAYANLIRSAGATPVSYPLRPPGQGERRWRLDVEALLSKLGDSTRAVILNNPGNPTGSVFKQGRLQAVIKGLAERDIPFISDEIYADYDWADAFVSSRTLAGAGPGITLSGLSKSHHLMGWRLGWMISDAETIEGLTPLHQHMVTCAPRPAQEAAITALANHGPVMAKNHRVFGERRQRVIELLGDDFPGLTEACGGAFYLFLDVRPWMEHFGDTVTMARQLLQEEDIMVIPGEGFGDRGLGHLRIAYTIGEPELSEGLISMTRFLNRYRPTMD